MAVKFDKLKESMRKYHITTDQLKEHLAKDLSEMIQSDWSVDEVYSYLTNQNDAVPNPFSFDGDLFLKSKLSSLKSKNASQWFINDYIKEVSERIYGNFDGNTIEQCVSFVKEELKKRELSLSQFKKAEIYDTAYVFKEDWSKEEMMLFLLGKMGGKIWQFGLEPEEYLVKSVKRHMAVDNFTWLVESYLDIIKEYYEEKNEEEEEN